MYPVGRLRRTMVPIEVSVWLVDRVRGQGASIIGVGDGGDGSGGRAVGRPFALARPHAGGSGLLVGGQ